MNMTPRQVRLLVSKGQLPKGEFEDAFRVIPESLPWRLVFDRKNRIMYVNVRGCTLASIGAGRWSAGGMGLADLRGHAAGEIENYYPLDYLIQWDKNDQLEVLEYVKEG